jgi:hypothetical protein
MSKTAKCIVPALPPDLTPAEAAQWAVSVLFRASLEHNWSPVELRRALIMTMIGPLVLSGDDAAIISDFAQTHLLARALRNAQEGKHS